jgi:Fe-S-cluster-containing dehydrogenase component
MVKEYGVVVDLERCIGCRTCTIACKAEHGIEIGSGIRVETVGGPHEDTPTGKYPKLSMTFTPVACMHCKRPPCLDVCPTQAIYKRADGIVLIDEGKCNGCQECLPACPYGALVFDSKLGPPRKCDLCFERLDQGFPPFCALCCSEQAISCGDLAGPESAISRAISQRGAYVLKPELRTGPRVYYCPQTTPRRI